MWPAASGAAEGVARIARGRRRPGCHSATAPAGTAEGGTFWWRAREIDSAPYVEPYPSERAGGCRAEAQESGTCVVSSIYAGGPFPCGHDATVDVAAQFRRQPSERAPVRSAAGTYVLLPVNESHAFAVCTTYMQALAAIA